MGGGVLYLRGREVLPEGVTLEQRSEGARYVESWGMSTLDRPGPLCTGRHKALCDAETERRPVWLGQNEHEGE